MRAIVVRWFALCGVALTFFAPSVSGQTLVFPAATYHEACSGLLVPCPPTLPTTVRPTDVFTVVNSQASQGVTPNLIGEVSYPDLANAILASGGASSVNAQLAGINQQIGSMSQQLAAISASQIALQSTLHRTAQRLGEGIALSSALLRNLRRGVLWEQSRWLCHGHRSDYRRRPRLRRICAQPVSEPH
jgi:hypothetical protein